MTDFIANLVRRAAGLPVATVGPPPRSPFAAATAIDEDAAVPDWPEAAASREAGGEARLPTPVREQGRNAAPARALSAAGAAPEPGTAPQAPVTRQVVPAPAMLAPGPTREAAHRATLPFSDARKETVEGSAPPMPAAPARHPRTDAPGAPQDLAHGMPEPAPARATIRPALAQTRMSLPLPLPFPRNPAASAPMPAPQLPVHVRIGTVEVRTRPASAPPPAPAPAGPAPSAPLGFGAYYRIRTYRG